MVVFLTLEINYHSFFYTFKINYGSLFSDSFLKTLHRAKKAGQRGKLPELADRGIKSHVERGGGCRQGNQEPC